MILAKARPVGVRVDATEEEPAPLATRLLRLVLDDPRTDPVLLGVRIILLLMLCYWTWTFAPARVADNVAGFSFLHNINLPFLSSPGNQSHLLVV